MVDRKFVEAADALRFEMVNAHDVSFAPFVDRSLKDKIEAYDTARSRLAAAQPADHPESIGGLAIGGLASRTPASKQGKKALDDMLLVFAKHDDDEEDCWTQPARRGVQYVSDLEWDLETQVRLASHRAEANESLRIMLSNLAAYTGTHFGPDEPLKNYERVRKTLTDKPEPPSIAAEKAEEPDAPVIAEAPDGTLPCVYCSNENLCVEIRKHPGMLGFSVRCGSATTFCGARGPVRPAQMDAVEEWNRAYRWVHPPKGAAPKPASEVKACADDEDEGACVSCGKPGECEDNQGDPYCHACMDRRIVSLLSEEQHEALVACGWTPPSRRAPAPSPESEVVLDMPETDSGPLGRAQLEALHRLLAPVLDAAGFSPAHETAKKAIERLPASEAQGEPSERIAKFLDALERRLDVDDDDAWMLSRSDLDYLRACLSRAPSPSDGVVRNLAMLVRRIKAYPKNREKLIDEAIDYCNRAGVGGSILRDVESPSPSPALAALSFEEVERAYDDAKEWDGRSWSREAGLRAVMALYARAALGGGS